MSATGFASHTGTELQLGVPNLMALRLDKSVTSRWKIGLGFGAIPLFLVTTFYTPTVNADVSDDYDLTVDPGAAALSSSLSAQWQATERTFLRFEIVVNWLSIQGNTYITSRATGNKAPYLDLEATAVLPRIAVSWGADLYRGESWTLLGGLGVFVTPTQFVFIRHVGPAAAYFDALPEMRSSVEDGLANTQEAAKSALRRSVFGAAILPSIWIAAGW